jgi:hypothetical protein
MKQKQTAGKNGQAVKRRRGEWVSAQADRITAYGFQRKKLL